MLIRPMKTAKRRHVFIFVASVQLFLIAFFSPIVSDAQMYADWARMNQYGNTNFGWKCLSKAMWALWPNAKSLLCAVSVISLYAVAHFVEKHSKDPFLSYFIYICMGIWAYSFFVFRQAIAFAVCLVAYDYLVDRDLLKFTIMVLIASLFHETALFFLLAYPFSVPQRNDRAKVCLEIVCTVVFLVFYRQLLSVMLSVFRNGWLYEISEEVDGVGQLTILVVMTVACYLLDAGHRESVFQKSIELAGLLQLMSLHFPLMVRMVHYFDIAAMIALPDMLEAQNEKRNKRVVQAIIYISMLCIYIFSLNYGFPGGAAAYTPSLP